jgi:hypothetical protein
MLATPVESRPRLRPRGEHRFKTWTESLEPRRLLDAAQPIVSPDLSASSGLPVLSLETGSDLAAIESQPINSTPGLAVAAGLPMASVDTSTGLASPITSMASTQPSVSLPSITTTFPPLNGAALGPSSFGPSATGPSTTLNPLGNDTETAVAAAAEVAQPTPGRSDRISSIIRATPIIPLPHYRSPDDLGDVPGPRVRPRPPVKAPAVPTQPPVEPPAPAPEVPKAAAPEPAPPARPVEVEPAVIPSTAPAEPKATPAEPKGPTTFNAWDSAIDLVETDLAEASSASLANHAEASMAIGAMLAAWGGWSLKASSEGRSRRRPLAVKTLEAGPGAGDGR